MDDPHAAYVLEPAAGKDYSIGRQVVSASEEAEAINRRIDVIELRLAVVSGAKVQVELYGVATEALADLSLDEGWFELIESAAGREERADIRNLYRDHPYDATLADEPLRRHVHNLCHSHVYVAVSAAHRVQSGRARSWKEAYEVLLREARASNPDATLPFRAAKNLTTAMSETYEVKLPEARRLGKAAFKPKHLREYDRVARARPEADSRAR